MIRALGMDSTHNETVTSDNEIAQHPPLHFLPGHDQILISKSSRYIYTATDKTIMWCVVCSREAIAGPLKTNTTPLSIPSSSRLELDR